MNALPDLVAFGNAPTASPDNTGFDAVPHVPPFASNVTVYVGGRTLTVTSLMSHPADSSSAVTRAASPDTLSTITSTDDERKNGSSSIVVTLDGIVTLFRLSQ